MSAREVADQLGPNPLASFYKVPRNRDGFFQEAHPKPRPVDFATDGVFVCGLAHSPQPIEESVSQAQAAAARAARLLCSPTMTVEGLVAHIDPKECVGCGVCAAICPYQAIITDENGKALVQEAVCEGRGVCAASCWGEVPNLPGFSDQAIAAQIEAL